MSHFCLLVVGEDYEKKLEPFCELDLSQEDMKTDSRAVFELKVPIAEVKEHRNKEIVEIEQRYLENLKLYKEFTPEVLMKRMDFTLDGDVYKADPIFNKCEEKEVRVSEVEEFRKKLLVYMEDEHQAKMNKYNAWTDDEYMDNYHGYVLSEAGWGFYSNPNSKWDWYCLGGRYRGRFIQKRNPKYPERIRIGEKSWGDNDKAHPRACDVITKCDIDFEEMARDRKLTYANDWEEVHGRPEFGKDKNGDELMYGKELATMSKEEYIAYAGTRVVSAFAVLKDDKWAENGRMGWWGIVSDEKDNWDEVFQKIWNTIGDEEVVACIDCHI